MKWSRQAVLVLKKRVFGNFQNDHLDKKLLELETHLENFDNILLSYRHKHEWCEVERLADEIDRMLEQASSTRRSPHLQERVQGNIRLQ